MRSYAKVFLALVLVAFILNELIPKSYSNRGIIGWITFHFFLLICACLSQRKLRGILSGEMKEGRLGAHIAVAGIVSQGRPIDPVGLILYSSTHIPENFETLDGNARKILEFSQKNPYIYDLAHTVYDHNFLRFSWLAVRKSNPAEFISALRTGDLILYHRHGSIIGAIIRFFTRCFWEHTSWYDGGGMLIDVAPGGVVRTPIENWIIDSKVTLAVLRQNAPPSLDSIKFMRGIVGERYAYQKVFLLWWRIFTGKVRTGLISPIVFTINLIQLSVVLGICLATPQLTRLQLFLFLLSAPYLFSSVYHPIAYIKDLNSFKKIFDAQSRN